MGKRKSTSLPHYDASSLVTTIDDASFVALRAFVVPEMDRDTMKMKQGIVEADFVDLEQVLRPIGSFFTTPQAGISPDWKPLYDDRV